MSHEAAADSIARSRPGDDSANGGSSVRAARNRAAASSSPRWSGQRNDRAVVGSAMWGKECRQYPGLRRTRASANTSGSDSTLTARLLVKLQNRRTGPAPNEENLFLLPDRKQNGPTVDLMSRRHPLSSTRTYRRR